MKNSKMIVFLMCVLLCAQLLLLGCEAQEPLEIIEDPWEPAENYYSKAAIYDISGAPSGTYMAQKNSRLYGVIDANNNVIVPFEYGAIYSECSEGIYGVADDLLPRRHEVLSWGFVNSDAEMIIEPKYRNIHMFVGDYAMVQEDTGHWFVIDKSGNPVSEVDLSDGEPPISKAKGYFIFTQGKQLGLYSADKNEIVISPGDYIDIRYTGKDSIFEIAVMLQDDIFPKEKDRYAGLFDAETGKVILEPGKEKYEYITYHHKYDCFMAKWEVFNGQWAEEVEARLLDDFTASYSEQY